MKKIVYSALIIALCITLFCALGIIASAETTVVDSGTCGENVTWSLDTEGLLTISGTGQMTSSPWLPTYVKNIYDVKIESGVVGIASQAFSGCKSLTSVTIPDSVTSIGNYAFRYCYKLIEVINHSSLNITAGSSDNGYVGYYAIEVHTGESKIVNCNDYLFYTCNGVNYLLRYVGNDKALVLPENYNGEDYEIYKYAFYNRTDITSVTIPDSVTSIGDCAFDGCTSLTSVTIPSSVTSIGPSAFFYCNLDAVYISDIAKWCAIKFDNASNPLSYANKLYLVDENGVAELITDLVIPDSVTSIGDFAFFGCTSLTSVTIPDSVETLGNYAFYGCSKLSEITLGESLTAIGFFAFDGCTSLNYSAYDNAYYLGNEDNPYLVLVKAKSIDVASCNIHNNTRFILNEAFSGCTSLTSITIPSGVTSIGSGAFESCNRLEQVTFSNNSSLKEIGSNAFIGCTNQLVEIPEGVESIGFQEFTGPMFIYLPNTVKGSVSLNFHLGGDLDVGGCIADIRLVAYNSTRIRTSDSNTRYHVENNCLIESAERRLAACGEADNIVIPSDGSVTVIGSYAFSRGQIIIPKSIIKIESSAFGNNVSNYTSIHYEGTAEDWAKVDIGDNNEVLLSDIFSYHVHEFGEWSVVYEETCTADGLKKHTCTTCGETESESIPAAHELLYRTGKDVTCTEGGYLGYYVCSGCDYSTYEYIAPIGHLFVTYISNNDATCVKDGTKTAICKRCDASDTIADEGSALGHVMGRATCTESAKCQRENCNHTEGEPLGHLTVNHGAKAATCTEVGWNEYQTCQRCSYSTKTTLPPLNHSYLNYVSNGDATCTADGTKTAKCERCTAVDTVTDVDSALGHDMSAVTCTEASKCKREGCEHTEGSALGHNLTYHAAKSPTCTEVGWNDYETCTRCSYITYFELQKLGHNFENYISNEDATCTADGTKTAKCERCTAVDTVTDVDSALGHDMSAATCTEASRCARDNCDYTEGNALGHDFANYAPNGDATCTADGTKTAKCERCTAVDTVTDVGSALGHDMSAATCTEASRCARDNCDYTEGNALGHDFVNYASNGDATCTADGTKTAKCERCTAVDTVTDVGSALGHDMSAATCTEASKCKREGCKCTEGSVTDHTYLNDNDADCNICGAVRDIAHEGGLSTGAIIAISVGSTVTVGAGSFSLIWFAIKKKKFSELILIFKKH